MRLFSSRSWFFCCLAICDFSFSQITHPQLFPSDDDKLLKNSTTVSQLETTEHSSTDNPTTTAPVVTSSDSLLSSTTSAEASEPSTTNVTTTSNDNQSTDSSQALITADPTFQRSTESVLVSSEEPTVPTETSDGVDNTSIFEAQSTAIEPRVTSNFPTPLTEWYTPTVARTTRRYPATAANVPRPIQAVQPRPSVEINLPGVGPGGGSNFFGDLLSSIAEGVQTYVGQAISSIPLPRFEDVAPNHPPFSLQLDNMNALPAPFQNLLNPCPLCETLDLTKVSGTWDIVYASENFIRSTLKDVGDIAGQLAEARNSPVTLAPRTFFSAYQTRRTISCAQIAFEDPIVFESLVDFPLRIGYTDGDIQRKVAGSMRFAGNGKYLLLIPEVIEFSARLCSSYSNIVAPNKLQQLTVGPETIVFVDMSGFPGCTNYIVLTKNSPQFFAELDEVVRDYIRRRRADTSSNPLQLISCSKLSRVQV
uniref:Uncharacterized protein n=1 Tax=Plectus sambesii TaxID=2011161 RepID=A0A914VP59_9BILA